MQRARLATALVGLLALALALPGTALAQGRHHPRSRHARTHHARVHTVRLAAATPSTAPTTNPSNNAGTVSSFSNGTLTLKLNDGTTVSGSVGPNTEIQCEAAASTSPTASMADHHADSSDNGDRGQSNAAATGAGTATPPSTQAQSQDNNVDNEAQGDGDTEDQGQGSCGTSALVAGATVREAELRVGPSGAKFTRITIVA